MGNSHKAILGLHGMLMLYSLSSICGKLAAGFSFLSVGFIVCYGGMIALLGIYALGWQQVIKRLPLTFAYANRAVTVVWGIVWGALFFSEPVTAGKLVGAFIVLVGVVLYATSGDDGQTSASAEVEIQLGGANGAPRRTTVTDRRRRMAPPRVPPAMGKGAPPDGHDGSGLCGPQPLRRVHQRHLAGHAHEERHARAQLCGCRVPQPAGDLRVHALRGCHAALGHRVPGIPLSMGPIPRCDGLYLRYRLWRAHLPREAECPAACLRSRSSSWASSSTR